MNADYALDRAIYVFGAYLLPTITNLIVLIYACAGFLRTKKPAFLLLIVACALSLVAVFALYVLRESGSPTENHALWLFWALDNLVMCVVGTVALLMLMRNVAYPRQDVHTVIVDADSKA